MKEQWPFVVVFLLAWIGTDLLIPWVRRLAFRWGKTDTPGERKIHTEPIPRLGGMAIFAGFCLGLAGVEWLEPGMMSYFKGAMLGVIAGAACMFLLGIVDDLYSVPAKIKLTVQIMAALLAFWLGVRIEFITNPLGGMIHIPLYIQGPLTVLWLVGITNTINLIDGLDGLAAGVSIISAMTLFIIGSHMHQFSSAFLALALAGGCIGFLRYNFNPAKIFMGDSGSLFLGFTLASISIIGVLKTAATVALAVPILALAFPIFDTAFAIIRRTYGRRPLFTADRGHIHHRLLNIGMSQRMAVTFIYSLSALTGGFALWLLGIQVAPSIVVVAAVVMVAGLWIGLRRAHLPIVDE